jgi:hypothetical protein
VAPAEESLLVVEYRRQPPGAGEAPAYTHHLLVNTQALQLAGADPPGRKAVLRQEGGLRQKYVPPSHWIPLGIPWDFLLVG